MSGNTVTVSLTEVRKAVAKRGSFLVEIPLDAIKDDVRGAFIILKLEGMTLSQAVIAILNDAGENALKLQELARAGEVAP